MMDNTKKYLTALKADKLEQARIFREVAETIKTTHKKFIKTSFDHQAAHKSTDGFGNVTFSIHYQQTRPDMYRANEYYTFYLVDTTDNSPIPPADIKQQILDAADAAKVTAGQIEYDLNHLDKSVRSLAKAIADYNAVADMLTAYTQEALGAQHIYNHRLGE